MAAKIDRKKIALVHVAKSQAGLSEAEYRDILAGAGVESSRDLDLAGFKAVMLAMQQLGFEPVKRQAPAAAADKKPWPGEYSPGRGMMNLDQARKMWNIWNRISHAPEAGREAALNKFLAKRVKVSNWRWLSYKKGQAVVAILHIMQNQIGKNK